MLELPYLVADLILAPEDRLNVCRFGSRVLRRWSLDKDDLQDSIYWLIAYVAAIVKQLNSEASNAVCCI